MGKASRDKGKRGERELAAELRRLGFTNARRGVQYQGGPDSPDVADAIPGVHIEVKRVEAFRLYPSLQQALDESDANETPVVMHRQSRRPWVVVVPLEMLGSFARDVVRELEGESDAG